MKKNPIVPITLLTGYLGAGKTTLINQVLTNQQGYKCAVIVNDIGEINIDADLIARGGAVTQKDENLVPLSNGCICCTLKTDLMNQIAELIATGKFDYLLIEASGICEPLPIAQSIAVLEGKVDKKYPAICRLDNIVTVVDALRMATEFGCGDALIGGENDDEDIENLLIGQIEFCSTVILSKTDMVNEEQLARVKAMIRTLQPKARIIESVRGNVPVSDILDTKCYDFEEAVTSAGWAQAFEQGEDFEEEHHHEHDHHHEHGEGCTCGHCCHDGEGHAEEYGIATFVYRRRRPFNREKFGEWVNGWPRQIIRCKGMLWFEDDRETAFVFEQAGVQISATGSGKWFACAPANERMRLLKQYPDIAADWDNTYGDREIKLVFIGQNMDKNGIIEALDNCLGE